MESGGTSDDGNEPKVRPTTDARGTKRSRSRSPCTQDDSLFVSPEALKKRVATGANGLSPAPSTARDDPEDLQVTAASDRCREDEEAAKVTVTTGPLQQDRTKPEADTGALTSVIRGPTLDGNGRVPGYAASKEGLPPCGFYSPDFKRAEAVVTNICDLISEAHAEAKATGYSNEAIEIVCGPSGLGRYRTPSDHYDVPGPVAALGPAGSGKSSATNSIMNQQKVAFEHDGDDRGTYLVHEYRAAPPDQLSKYRVVATYFSVTDIQRDIVVYYGHINAFLFDDGEEAADDESALEQRYKTALCFFMHLLAHRKEFQTQESTEKYFTDGGDDVWTVVCEKLYGLVDQFLQSRESYSNGEERYDVNSESELQEIFKQVCRPPKARGSKAKEGSPWPIIRSIVVHQSVRVLDAGVILADTPGFNDQNLAVVRNTMRYLKTAGTILIFLTYKRIDQNSPLDQLIRECMALGKMHHIRLVITSIDEMKPLDVDDMDAEGRARLKAAESKLQSILSEIKETEAAKKRAKGVDSDKFEEADDRLETLQLRKVQAAAAVRQTNIEIRCRDIRATLQGRIQTIDKCRGAPELPISFISNTQYQLHVAGYDPKDSDPKESPFLDLKATGIPQLRQELLTSQAGGKMGVLQSLVARQLPNKLHSITGILAKSKLERISEVRKIVTKVTRRHEGPVKALVADVLQAFEQHITSSVTSHLAEWRDEAQAALHRWAEMHPTTFRGFCSRHGEWSSHKIHGHLNFRSDLCQVSAKQLSLAFNRLDTQLVHVRRDFSLDCQELFDGVCRDIEDSEDAQGNVLDPFFGFVKGTAGEIVDSMMTEFDVLKEKLDQIRWAATLNSEASYFSKGMSATYETAALLSAKTHVLNEGPPAAPRGNNAAGTRKLRAKRPTIGSARVHIILNKFRGEAGEKSIFLSVAQLAKGDLAEYLKLWAARCNGIVEKGYQKIIDYFDNHFQADEVKEEENPVAVDLIRDAVKKASELLKDAERYLAECEAYEKKRTVDLMGGVGNGVSEWVSG